MTNEVHGHCLSVVFKYHLVAGARRVVLATSIAESSLTIEGVRAVVDSGMARVPVQDATSGLTRLDTVPASLASADQRRGRAGAFPNHARLTMSLLASLLFLLLQGQQTQNQRP